MKRVVRNKQDYCNYHGYKLIDGSKYVETTPILRHDHVTAGAGNEKIVKRPYWSGLNGGVWIAKSSPWTHWYMNEL